MVYRVRTPEVTYVASYVFIARLVKIFIKSFKVFEIYLDLAVAIAAWL